MLAAILICAFMVKNVATQRTATATLGTTKSCVLIGDDVKMNCTVSADCCTTFPRVWKKDTGAVVLLNNGGSSDKSKYVEDGVGTTGFNLIIKNVQKSDFGLNYSCSYGVTESNIYYLDDILCPSSGPSSGNCWKCVGQDYGWSILGSVISTVIMIFVKVIIMKIAKVKKFSFPYGIKSVLRDGLLFIISAVFNAIITALIGYFVCHCVDGTDRWFIVLGLCTSGITGGIALICMLMRGDDVDFRFECCLQAFGALCAGCFQVLIALCAGKKSKQDGDQNEKDEKSQPLAE